MHKSAARWIVFAHGHRHAIVSNRQKAPIALRLEQLSSISRVARKLR
jgi:hypothetical protein